MAVIDCKAARCRHCYKCVRHCDVKAITMKNGYAQIMPDNCILCGRCLEVCPQSAKVLVSDLDRVREMIAQGDKVVVSLAPAYMGLLKYNTIGQVRAALLRLGFADVRETAEGAALVTSEYVRLLEEGRMKNIITTGCPSANDLIEKYYPQLIPYMAPVVSPMIAHGMMIKQELGADVKVVFVSTCIAGETDARDARHSGYIDAVLNFNDVNRWLDDEDIDIEECADMPFEALDPRVNRLYAVAGGAINSVVATEKQEDGYRKLYIGGDKDCIELCESMTRGEITGCFVEMNMCSGGCVKGAAGGRMVSRFKAKLDVERAVPREPVPESETAPILKKISLAKTFADHSPKEPVPTEKQILDILAMIGKHRPEDELNCGACGYPTCREKAIAVFQKKAERNMCVPFMYERAESFSNLVMESSPNIVLIVDENMRIMEYSAVSERYFGKTRAEAVKMRLDELMDPVDFRKVFETHENIYRKKMSYPNHHLDVLESIIYIEKENAVLATFVDITKEEEQARLDYEKKLETIDLAQKVIHKQMMVAQEIAGLLGETTAETKTTLTTLCRSLIEDGGDNGGN